MSFFPAGRQPTDSLFMCSDRTRPYTKAAAVADLARYLERVGADPTKYKWHGVRVEGYNNTKAACGEELAVVHGGWESQAHARYDRFELVDVANIPSALTGGDLTYAVAAPRPRPVARGGTTRGGSSRGGAGPSSAAGPSGANAPAAAASARPTPPRAPPNTAAPSPGAALLAGAMIPPPMAPPLPPPASSSAAAASRGSSRGGTLVDEFRDGLLTPPGAGPSGRARGSSRGGTLVDEFHAVSGDVFVFRGAQAAGRTAVESPRAPAPAPPAPAATVSAAGASAAAGSVASAPAAAAAGTSALVGAGTADDPLVVDGAPVGPTAGHAVGLPHYVPNPNLAPPIVPYAVGTSSAAEHVMLVATDWLPGGSSSSDAGSTRSSPAVTRSRSARHGRGGRGRGRRNSFSGR